VGDIVFILLVLDNSFARTGAMNRDPNSNCSDSRVIVIVLISVVSAKKIL
jgi:hypothetical protein